MRNASDTRQCLVLMLTENRKNFIKAKIKTFFIKIEAQKYDLKKKIDRCNK